MKNSIISIFLCLSIFPSLSQTTIHPQSSEYVWPTDPLVKEKLEKWRDLKFGMIVHWGLYSVPGIIESWELCSESWIERDSTISYDDYKKWYWGLQKDFNPVNFNPEQWAKAAKAAGMKYVVFTTKHHDGFCMFDTKQTDFSIAKGPFAGNPKSDITKYVFEAFRNKGFMIGAYFSKPDWHSEYYWWPKYATPDRNNNYDIRKFPWRWNNFKEYTFNQIKELMYNYGNIDILWLDGGWVRPLETVNDEVRAWGANIPEWSQDIDMPHIASMARKAQPGILLVDRTVKGIYENYQTPEQHIPEKPLEYPWESCLTLGYNWGYVPSDKYKSATQIIHSLIEVVAKGGSLLLGIGPRPDGTLSPEQIQKLQEIGTWLNANGQAIYDTRITQNYRDGEIFFTQSKNQNTRFAIIRIAEGSKTPSYIEWENNVPAKGSKIFLLSNKESVKWKRQGHKTIIYLPPSALNKTFPALAFSFSPDISTISTPSNPQNTTHTFEIKEGNFMYNNKPFIIHSGEMHYPRVPHEYWRHRFKMMRAMGLNTVATYVFWNYHNTAPGIWDFTTGNHNLAEYIKTAQEEGLFVILRPGPYVCAEWDFGGYPWWLQKNKNLVIRSSGPFIDSCNVYIQKLSEQIKDLQITKGGPIIMVQIENEFGSYVTQQTSISKEEHRKYYYSIKKLLEDAGFNVPFFTSDGTWLFDGGVIPGILPTANGETNIENLITSVNKYNSGKGPYMVAEYYPGWLDHWGEPFVTIKPDEVVKQIEKYLQNNISFNFYMVHGGTNFGFTSGANYAEGRDIQPDITSYDYDAPISEAGWPTAKYYAIRDVMQKYSDNPLPPVPDCIPVIKPDSIVFNESICLFNLLDKCLPQTGEMPKTFEDLNQNNGYVLYQRNFPEAVKGKLHIPRLHDFATVYINKQKAGILNRALNTYSLEVNIPENGTLSILVENMGRINYGAQITENKKGIVSDIFVNDRKITGNWLMYSFPMDTFPKYNQVIPCKKQGLPTLYHGSFNINKTGDTFLDMSNWGKGIVFINGHNLGRYWNIGPQQTLYLPGCWLRKGKNEIQIFEQLNDNIQKILSTRETPILNDLK